MVPSLLHTVKVVSLLLKIVSMENPHPHVNNAANYCYLESYFPKAAINNTYLLLDKQGIHVPLQWYAEHELPGNWKSCIHIMSTFTHRTLTQKHHLQLSHTFVLQKGPRPIVPLPSYYMYIHNYPFDLQWHCMDAEIGDIQSRLR